MYPAPPNGNAVALGDHGERADHGDHLVAVVRSHIANGIAVFFIAVNDALDASADADQTAVIRDPCILGTKFPHADTSFARIYLCLLYQKSDQKAIAGPICLHFFKKFHKID